jgi:two-component system, LytTR family, response regulator
MDTQGLFRKYQVAMEALRIYIVDDERSARELITNLLSDVDEIEIVGKSDSAENALKEIIEIKPDVVLLDIQMPRQDGFYLISRLQEYNVQPEIIFITAFEQYAIRAIKSSAFDYLLKPVKKSELILSLSKLALEKKSTDMKEKFDFLIYQLSDHKKLKFKNRTGFYMIDPDEILFCRADSNYTVLELEGGRSFTVSMNLGKVEEILPDTCFFRISRSVIINIHFLSMVNRKTMTCELVNKETHVLSISRKYLKELQKGCDNHFSLW